jgi:choline dehydrogenase-like flavoprotein
LILDIKTQTEPATASADVCIVGAGIAGLLLATRLRSAGLSVVVIESGGHSLEGEEHVLNEVVSLGTPYYGATKGRARCLGGTSTLWGGALIPFLASDLASRPYLGLEAWPVAYDDLVPCIAEVERVFGVAPGPYEPPTSRRSSETSPGAAADSAAMVERAAKWPTFRNRNVATLFSRQINSDKDLRVWLNATVCTFELTENGRLAALGAVSMGGHKLSVHAATFVLCPGTIEATRLLLLLDRQHAGRVFAGCEALGRYFYDHVSIVAARLVPPDPVALNKLAGFRFSGSTMRSPRFELAPEVQAASSLPSAFGHISFEAAGASGFDTLRALLRSVQQRGFPDPRLAFRLLGDLPYLMRVGYWRFGRNQLLWPRPADYHLHIVAEQLPHAANHIALSDQLDPLGCPRAALAWTIDKEHATIRGFARHFERFWRQSGLNRLASIEWSIDEALGALSSRASLNDIYHPGGSTRMGRDARSSVVDENLRVHAIDNLYVASTSVFPSGASANPTLMLMAFTVRLASCLAASRGFGRRHGERLSVSTQHLTR